MGEWRQKDVSRSVSFFFSISFEKVCVYLIPKTLVGTLQDALIIQSKVEQEKAKLKATRLLVSGQSPECSDCLLRFYGAVITLRN